MVDILAHTKQFKTELKDKWLDYYEANRNWLQYSMNENSKWYDWVEYNEEKLKNLGLNSEEIGNLEFELDKDFGEDYSPRRPECHFILGVISVLEPQVKSLLELTASLTTDPEKMLIALGLDFDPEIELKIHSFKKAQQKSAADSQYLDQIREEIKT